MPKFEENSNLLTTALESFLSPLYEAISSCNNEEDEEEIPDKQFLKYALHHLLEPDEGVQSWGVHWGGLLPLFANHIVKHLSANNPGGTADFVARYGPNKHDVNHAENFAPPTYVLSEYGIGMQDLMRYLRPTCPHTPCTLAQHAARWRDIDVHAYSWLVKYKLIDCTVHEPYKTAKRGLLFLWMLCGGKENFGQILYATVPTEGWPWVADEAKETRTRNQAMEDRVWESSRSPSGLPYDVRMNMGRMLGFLATGPQEIENDCQPTQTWDT